MPGLESFERQDHYDREIRAISGQFAISRNQNRSSSIRNANTLTAAPTCCRFLALAMCFPNVIVPSTNGLRLACLAASRYLESEGLPLAPAPSPASDVRGHNRRTYEDCFPRTG